MARFANRWDLEKAFFQGDIEEGHTGSKCSNYLTDFKKDWKYKFIGNILYENGKISMMLHRDLKMGISFDEYQCGVTCSYKIKGYDIIRIQDSREAREYLSTNNLDIKTFINDYMYCAVAHLATSHLTVINTIERGRSNAHHQHYHFVKALKEHKQIREFCKKKFKEHNIEPFWYYVDSLFWKIDYKGFRQCWENISYIGYLNKASLKYRIDNFGEFILAVKTVYYHSLKHKTIYCKNVHTYPAYMRYCYDDPTILYKDFKAIYDYNMADYKRTHWYYFKDFDRQILNKISKWNKDTFKKN